MSEMGRYIFQSLGALVLLGALSVAVLWAARRWGGLAPRTSERMKLIDALSLGPGLRLLIVEVDGRQFLIGATTQSITFLTALDADKPSPEHREAAS